MRTHTQTTLCLALGSLLVAGAGCEPEAPPPQHRVTAEVFSDMLPLQNVELVVGTEVKARTDAHGMGSFVVTAPEGTQINLVARCPANTRSPEPVQITLRTVESVNQAASARGVVQRLNCPPAERSVAVVVRTDRRPGLPIRQGDREIARTDEQGVAVLTFRARPNTPIQLSMDTSSNNLLMPQNPRWNFNVPDNDEVQRWDVNFQDQDPGRVDAPHGPRAPDRVLTNIGTGQDMRFRPSTTTNTINRPAPTRRPRPAPSSTTHRITRF